MSNYTEQTISGYKVTIFTGYYGTQVFINDKDGNQIYAHKVSGDARERAIEVIARAENKTPSQILKLETARAALASVHIESVEASFEYEADGARYYSAITKDSGVPHLYTVKVWEDSDGANFAHCNCPAKSACRHIGQVAKLDAANYSRKVYYASFGNYRAHKANQFKKAA